MTAPLPSVGYSSGEEDEEEETEGERGGEDEGEGGDDRADLMEAIRKAGITLKPPKTIHLSIDDTNVSYYSSTHE